MLTQELKSKYSIKGTWDTVAAIDYLFRGDEWVDEKTECGIILHFCEKDPASLAEDLACMEGIKWYDVSYAIGMYGSVVVQLIEFKNQDGRDRYLRDKITIFEHKQM